MTTVDDQHREAAIHVATNAERHVVTGEGEHALVLLHGFADNVAT